MIPVLFLLLICSQVTIFKSPTREYSLPVLEASIYNIQISMYNRKQIRKQNRMLPSNIHGFEPKWTQVVKRTKNDDGTYRVSIFTPWYFRRNFVYVIVGIVVIIVFLCLLPGHPWFSISPLPIVMGTAWVNGNTQANPTADDMDGIGTDLKSGDTVNITKTLEINKSVGCGAIAAVADFTIDPTFTFTLDTGVSCVFNGPAIANGSFVYKNTNGTFNDALVVNVGGSFSATSGAIITGNVVQLIDIYGVLSFVGVNGNNVTVTGFGVIGIRGGSNITMHYVTLTQGVTANAAWQWIVGAAITHSLDHVSLTHNAGSGGLVSTNVTTKITFTNSSISGAVGVGWDLQDVVVYSGAMFQFSNSSFNFVGMQDGIGWVVRNTSGSFNVHGVLNSETPDSGYRAGNVTGSFALSEADVYSGAHTDSFYTLGVGLSSTLITLNHFTSVDTFSNSFKATLGCYVDGTLYCFGSIVDIKGNGALFGYSLFVDGNGTYNGGSGPQSIGSIGFIGTFTATSNKITVTSRNTTIAWFNGGVFNNSNGSIDFIGQSSTSFFDILGDNAWYGLQISVSIASFYRFEVSKTQTVSGRVAFSGANGSLLVLNSTTGAAKWGLTVQSGTQQSVNYVNVGYSDASAGSTIIASHSVNSGNNLNWSFLIGGWGGGGNGGNGENGGQNGKPPGDGDQNGGQITPSRMSYNIDEEMLKQNEQEYLDWIKRHPRPTYYSSYGWVNEIDPDKVFHAVPIKKKWKKVKVVWVSKK